MFACRLVSGHWRAQTGVSRIGEEGTVSTAGVCFLNVLTGREQRRPEWADVAWLAMRVHVGRQRKMGVADVIDVEEDEPPTRKRKGRPPQGDTEPPPPKSRAYGHPSRAGGAGGARRAGGRAGAEAAGAGVGGPAAGGGVGGTRDQRGGRQPRPRGPSGQGQRRQAGLRVAVGGRHQGAEERDPLATKVKTLERDLATLRKAKPAAQPAEAMERLEGAEAPPGDKRGGQCGRCLVPPGRRIGVACSGRGVRRPDVGSVHRPADGHDGQWQAGRCGQRGPRRPQGDCRTGGSAPAVPPPIASRRRPWTPPLWRRWGSRAPRALLAGALLQGGGGGVAHPLPSGPPVLSNHHECYPAPPPPSMGSLTNTWGTPPPLCEFFCSTVCTLFGVCYAPGPVSDIFCGTVCILFGVCYAP